MAFTGGTPPALRLPFLGAVWGGGRGGLERVGWVRDRKGGKVTSYDWLGGGGAVSWHIHTQVHFSLHSEHTSCIMDRTVLTGTVNC